MSEPNTGSVLWLGASVKELDARLATMKAQHARLQAEILGATKVSFLKEVQNFPDVIKVQQALFEQKRRSLQEELRTLEVAVPGLPCIPIVRHAMVSDPGKQPAACHYRR